MVEERLSLLKAELFASVGQQLTERGFELVPARDKFVRHRDGITDHFQLVFKDSNDG